MITGRLHTARQTITIERAFRCEGGRTFSADYKVPAGINSARWRGNRLQFAPRQQRPRPPREDDDTTAGDDAHPAGASGACGSSAPPPTLVALHERVDAAVYVDADEDAGSTFSAML